MRRLIFMGASRGTLYIFRQCGPGASDWTERFACTITDKSQASIEDAKVMAENQATGVSATTTTSSPRTYQIYWSGGAQLTCTI
jgi:hypothetical protein